MPAQGTLQLNDAQASPVAHNFVPSGVVNGIATWHEKTASVLAGYFKLTFSMKFPTNGKDPIRHQLKLVVPTAVTETLNSVNYVKVVRTALVNVDVVIPQDSTLQERKDIASYMRDVFVNSSGYFGSQIANNDPTT